MNIRSVGFQCFSLEQVKEINKEIQKSLGKKEDPSLAAGNVNKIGDFWHVPCHSIMESVYSWIHGCQAINRDRFGYDIHWSFQLDTFMYNVYGEDGEYGWHIDANKEDTLLDYKLTCLLNLSEEPYEGGDLLIIDGEKKLNMPSGSGVVFTSLLGHKVTPVTKGIRTTLTYLASGPLWK